MPHPNNKCKKINLPGLTATLSCPAGLTELLLVGGGRAPSAAWLRSVAAERRIHAIDHGLDACLAAEIIPDTLLGDGDSASADSWARAAALAIPIEKHPVAKDLTDTELCLQKIKAGEPNSFILLTGAFGGRFDHLFSTAYSFLHSGLNGCLTDDHETLFFLRDKDFLSLSFSQKPKALSLLPLSPDCEGITSQGVRWPLTKATLSQRLPSAVSNELAADSSTWHVTLQQGLLGVYICWDESPSL